MRQWVSAKDHRYVMVCNGPTTLGTCPDGVRSEPRASQLDLPLARFQAEGWYIDKNAGDRCPACVARYGPNDNPATYRPPVRIQQRRTKGSRIPVGAVVVSRPSRWGNPFRVVRDGGFFWVEDADGLRQSGVTNSTDRAAARRTKAETAVRLYRQHLVAGRLPYDLTEVHVALAGRDLACWCPPGEPCHADVLLELANMRAAVPS